MRVGTRGSRGSEAREIAVRYRLPGGGAGEPPNGPVRGPCSEASIGSKEGPEQDFQPCGGGPCGCYGGWVPTWLVWLTAPVVGTVIWKLGIASIRSFSAPPPGSLDVEKPPAEPEDVEGLDVYLVCGECGTEFHVSKLGELQIPRHCGEKMLVTRRARDT